MLNKSRNRQDNNHTKKIIRVKLSEYTKLQSDSREQAFQKMRSDTKVNVRIFNFSYNSEKRK